MRAEPGHPRQVYPAGGPWERCRPSLRQQRPSTDSDLERWADPGSHQCRSASSQQDGSLLEHPYAVTAFRPVLRDAHDTLIDCFQVLFKEVKELNESINQGNLKKVVQDGEISPNRTKRHGQSDKETRPLRANRTKRRTFGRCSGPPIGQRCGLDPPIYVFLDWWTRLNWAVWSPAQMPYECRIQPSRPQPRCAGAGMSARLPGLRW
jgi:hypothetical protein